jgi:transposase
MSFGTGEDRATVRRKRRSWSVEEKRRIVDESLEDGASIAEVARRHDLNANQLFTWRRQFGVEPQDVEQQELRPILPVTIAPDVAAEHSVLGSTGQMEIVLVGGDRILIWADVETAALMRVLKALARR